EGEPTMKSLATLLLAIRRVFNWKFALVSAILNAAYAVWVNADYGSDVFWAAGWSQAYASFFSTGVTARIVQYFSEIPRPLPAYFWGSLVPATLTFACSASSHWMNETPELLATCAMPTLISYTTSFGTNLVTRRGWK